MGFSKAPGIAIYFKRDRESIKLRLKPLLILGRAGHMAESALRGVDPGIH